MMLMGQTMEVYFIGKLKKIQHYDRLGTYYTVEDGDGNTCSVKAEYIKEVNEDGGQDSSNR